MIPELNEIEKRRRNLGLTQKELAKIAHTTQSTIAKIEAGEVDPSFSTVKGIFAALDGIKKIPDKVASDLMNSHIFSVNGNQLIIDAIKIMKREGISQLIVIDAWGHPIGNISEKGILAKFQEDELFDPKKNKIAQVIEEPFPTISPTTPISTINHILRDSLAVVVIKKNKMVGIITKSDLLKNI